MEWAYSGWRTPGTEGNENFFDMWLAGEEYSPQSYLRMVKIDAQSLREWAQTSQKRGQALDRSQKEGLPPLLYGCRVSYLLIDYDSLAEFAGLDVLLGGDNLRHSSCVRLLAPPESVSGALRDSWLSAVYEIWCADWAAHEMPLPSAAEYRFCWCSEIRTIGTASGENMKAEGIRRRKQQRSANAGEPTPAFVFHQCGLESIAVDLDSLADSEGGITIAVQRCPKMTPRSLDAMFQATLCGETPPESTIALILGEEEYRSTPTWVFDETAETAVHVRDIGWDSRLARNVSFLEWHGMLCHIPSAGSLPETAKGKEPMLYW